MTERQQTEILHSFKDGDLKVMVCTSVCAEGIDVPDCNIVINYHFFENEIPKIQMKGYNPFKISVFG
ncbi:hypothetical protein DPMN_180970 [Dreissena polymorpha]|uniref:Helicase C-terminal domain-containing protein n=1 Tax=Dreissena polymorpha TaxID=45954 RepID=A0A9D4I153_DREPO|nr:hypothetical protein DPMN_180970 [Dreissena polymorpha]